MDTKARPMRRVARGDVDAKIKPDKLGLLTTLLENIYWNGFEARRGMSFRIARSKLRRLAAVGRLESGTMEKLVGRVRKEGFVLFPLDSSDYACAKEWIFDKYETLSKLQPADDAVLKKAQKRGADLSD